MLVCPYRPRPHLKTVTSRPAVLTAESVVADFGPWLYKIIRSFHIHDTEDSDLFNEIILAYITPSKKLGTTYLDRYDPSKGAVTTYLYFYASHILKAQLRHCKKRNRLCAHRDSSEGVGTPVEGGKAGRLTEVGEQYRSEILAEGSSKNDAEVFENLEHGEILRALRSKGSFASRSPSGKPRSSRRVAIAILADKSVSEIAKDLGLSTQTVRDKMHALSNDPTLQAIAEDRGLKTPSK